MAADRLRLPLPDGEFDLTAQMPERFINDNERVDVLCLRLYFVSADLPVQPSPPKDHLRCTALWRGYVATWRLNDDRSLDLLRFEFPHYEDSKTVVQELSPQRIKGDFSLAFRHFFHGPTTEIPFQDGMIIEDPGMWRIEDQRLTAQVTEHIDDSGVVARTIGGVGFIPRSLLQSRDMDLQSLVGKRVQCIIHDCDARGSFIYKPVAEFEDVG